MFGGLGNELAEHVVCIPAVWRRGWAGLSLARTSSVVLYHPNQRIVFRVSAARCLCCKCRKCLCICVQCLWLVFVIRQSIEVM